MTLHTIRPTCPLAVFPPREPIGALLPSRERPLLLNPSHPPTEPAGYLRLQKWRCRHYSGLTSFYETDACFHVICYRVDTGVGIRCVANGSRRSNEVWDDE